MSGFPSRQPYLNIGLAAAGVAVALVWPQHGWRWALVAAVLAPLVVFAAFALLAGLVVMIRRWTGRN
jgi:hypothetical protein